ncbi:hypothetical protein [Roseivirga echinicomitans]|nr:hypothetical protein [Roseivirga echinicomitans]
MSATITWAIKDRNYVHVSTFEPNVGLNCGCVCPECKEHLGSRIYSKNSNRESCYFHKNEESTCTGGQGESELHLLAKKIFEKNNWLMTPPFETTGKLKFDYKKVEFENIIGNIRPDIILTSETGNQLLVEIGVTSFIKGNHKKISEIERLRIPTVEIDLKELHIENPIIDSSIESELRSHLIESIDKKKWIWNIPSIVNDASEGQSMNSELKDLLILIMTFIGLRALIVRWKRRNSSQKKHRPTNRRKRRKTVYGKSTKY